MLPNPSCRYCGEEFEQALGKNKYSYCLMHRDPSYSYITFDAIRRRPMILTRMKIEINYQKHQLVILNTRQQLGGSRLRAHQSRVYWKTRERIVRNILANLNSWPLKEDNSLPPEDLLGKRIEFGNPSCIVCKIPVRFGRSCSLHKLELGRIKEAQKLSRLKSRILEAIR